MQAEIEFRVDARVVEFQAEMRSEAISANAVLNPGRCQQTRNNPVFLFVLTKDIPFHCAIDECFQCFLEVVLVMAVETETFCEFGNTDSMDIRIGEFVVCVGE